MKTFQAGCPRQGVDYSPTVFSGEQIRHGDSADFPPVDDDGNVLTMPIVRMRPVAAGPGGMRGDLNQTGRVP